MTRVVITQDKGSCVYVVMYIFYDCESGGENVMDLEPGNHVLPVFTGKCKECAHCKSEESNTWRNLLRINTYRGVMIHDERSRFSSNGKHIYHFVRRLLSVSTLWSKINPLLLQAKFSSSAVEFPQVLKQLNALSCFDCFYHICYVIHQILNFACFGFHALVLLQMRPSQERLITGNLRFGSSRPCCVCEF